MSDAGGHRPGQRGERGSGTLWTVTAATLVLFIGAAVAGLTVVVAAQHRAAAAADLAALAVAAQAAGAGPGGHGGGRPCAVGARVSAGNGARLVACRVEGAVADVAVEVRVRAGWWPAIAVRTRARAGP